MRSAALVFITLMIIAATFSVFCSIYIRYNKKADNVPIYDARSGKCVVTSAPLEKGKTVEIEYKGKKYVLCCLACKSVFKKDPGKFMREGKPSKHNAYMQRYPQLFYKSKL